MTAVVITAGIVFLGSVMGLSGIAAGLTLSSGYGVEAGIAAGLLTALLWTLTGFLLVTSVYAFCCNSWNAKYLSKFGFSSFQQQNVL